jgi:chromosome segregation ATPase
MRKSIFGGSAPAVEADMALIKTEIQAMRQDVAELRHSLLPLLRMHSSLSIALTAISHSLLHTNHKEKEIMSTLQEILAKSAVLDDVVNSYKTLKEAADAHVAELEGQLATALAAAAPADVVAAIEKNIDLAIAAVSGAQAVMRNTGDSLGFEVGPSAPVGVSPDVVITADLPVPAAEAAPIDAVPPTEATEAGV